MIRINLVSYSTNHSVNNAFARDFFLTFIFCVLIYFSVEHYASTIDQKISDTESRIEQQKKIRLELEKEIEKSKEIMEKVTAAKSRGKQLKQLGQGRKSSVIILDHLQIKHPERMWFDKISFSAASRQLELTGFALDHAVIADYMKRLKETGQADDSDVSELRDFIPKQLQKFSTLESDSERQVEKEQIKSFDIVNLKSLKSELVEGVTLQRFEIIILIKNG